MKRVVMPGALWRCANAGAGIGARALPSRMAIFPLILPAGLVTAGCYPFLTDSSSLLIITGITPVQACLICTGLTKLDKV
ncbi:hypothetical protein ACLB1M_29000 [Escherichia coli]